MGQEVWEKLTILAGTIIVFVGTVGVLSLIIRLIYWMWWEL